VKTRAVGKLVLAIILGYAGLMLASLAGGGLAGVLGVILHLSAETIASLEWIFPKVIFLGTLVGLLHLAKADEDEPTHVVNVRHIMSRTSYAK
jgi:hypothetical protein